MNSTPEHGRPAMTDAASAYLDALRALGANLVIVSHVLALYFGIKGTYAFGSLGVTIFFLLSGFLIMQSMLKRAPAEGPQLPGFLADRAARILTPYIPALLLIALIDFTLIQARYGNSDGANSGPLAFVGNLLLLQDHSIFQLLDIAGMEVSWRIRPYNTAEPFWTVAIEIWIYVSIGLFFFCVCKGERLRRGWMIGLGAIAVPVFVWNAAAGGGKSLSLIWLLGAIAGYLFHRWRANGYANGKIVGTAIASFAVLALAGRYGKIGFEPYDLQTAMLLALAMFGALGVLLCITTPAPSLKRTLDFCASYSYSLYLLHNTVLIVVLETFSADASWLRVAVAVLLAHLTAYLLYLAFERHYRAVARWLRPHFESVLRGRSRARSQPMAAGLET